MQVVPDLWADRVLVDAPCSGTGIFRRNPAEKLTLTSRYVEHCVRQQRSILKSVSRLVKDGGFLVYATCSLLLKEDEEIIRWFLDSHPAFSLVSAESVLKNRGVALHCPSMFMTLFPHRHTTDGFFAAVLVRGATD
jgi:16S rRNA (cytosine967-C5)-methyltransferase